MFSVEMRVDNNVRKSKFQKLKGFFLVGRRDS